MFFELDNTIINLKQICAIEVFKHSAKNVLEQEWSLRVITTHESFYLFKCKDIKVILEKYTMLKDKLKQAHVIMTLEDE